MLKPEDLVERSVGARVSVIRQIRSLADSTPWVLKAGILSSRGPAGVAKLATSVLRWHFSPAALMEAAAHLDSNHRAIIDDMGELTYGELRDQALRFTETLQHLGVEEGSQVAVIARNSRVVPMCLISCAYLGATPMIINPASSPAQMSRIILEYGATVVVADGEYAIQLEVDETPIIAAYGTEGRTSEEYPDNVYAFQDEINRSAGRPKLKFRAAPAPLIIMSSGTTGVPKGVVRAIPKSPAVLGSVLPKIPWRKAGTVQLTCSLFHAWGWMNLNVALATKSTMVLRREFDPRQAVRDCIDYNVCGVLSSAVFLRDFQKEYDQLSVEYKQRIHLEFIASSGNAIPPILVRGLSERFGQIVCNFYGSTEHGPVATASGPELFEDPSRAGTIAPGVRMAIVRDDGTEAAVGEIGKIYSCNAETMVGYLSARDKVSVHDAMLGTGDLGHMDAQGFLHVHGRSDDMVIKGGENVYPRELEDFLLRQPGVRDAYVRGVRQDIVARVDAYIVVADNEEGAKLDDDAVRELIRTNLAEHNVPDFICRIKEMPRNDAGKVVPRLLPQPSV